MRRRTRARALVRLTRAGFRVARALPYDRAPRALRPADEIAARLLALVSLFTWVTCDEATTDARVRESLRDGRDRALTRRERATLAMPRRKAYARHVATIGWRLENMWSLAWVLGMKPAPALDGRMIGDAAFDAILTFAGSRRGLAALTARARVRSVEAVVALEDLFYCAHNAVVGARLGARTVAKGFDPLVHGAVIQERRHALTWVLSPGTTWDATALDT